MKKPTIFVSHITNEKEVALALKDAIENQFLGAIDVFVSSHEDSLQLGDDWMNTIKKSMMDCELLIVLCSPISIKRTWINFEAGSGWIRGIPVIPMCHSGMKPSDLPVPINSFQGGMLSNKDDLQLVFRRIANILNMNTPKTDNLDFHKIVKGFEDKVSKTALSQDAVFIHNFLKRDIDLLKYAIFNSTLGYGQSNKDAQNNEIKNFEFTFHDVPENLFNEALLMIFDRKKIYQVFFEITTNLTENLKFLLSSNTIQLTENLKLAFQHFLFSKTILDNWHEGIHAFSFNLKNAKAKDDKFIQYLKEIPLPPERLPSNMRNYFIDYYESLKYVQSWIITYEEEINKLIEDIN